MINRLYWKKYLFSYINHIHFLELAIFGSNTLFSRFLSLVKYDLQITHFDSFGDMENGREFSSCKRKFDFEKQSEVRPGQVWTER